MTADTRKPELTAAVAAEIRALRKGRGIQAANLDRRIGPNLLELSTVGPRASLADRRNALVNEFNGHTSALPYDLRIAIRASLGLATDTKNMPLFKDRIAWLGERIGFGRRTALRRVEDAEAILAEQIAAELSRRRGRTASAPTGWYLGELKTLLRLDLASPEAHEQRRIVAVRDNIREVMASWDVPHVGDAPRATTLAGEVAYGGRLVRREQPSRGRYQFMVRLPVPVRAGQSHEYGLILRVADDSQMRPHYIFTPECRCDSFELRVKFSPSRRPRWVRRVYAETVRVFETPQPGNDRIPLDDAGEVCVRFENLTMYLGYGVQWQM